MLRFVLRRAASLIAGLAGAALLAAAVAALGEPGATANASTFSGALLAKVPHVFTLDLGRSTISGLSAAAETAPAFRASMELLTLGAIIALAIGAPLGMTLAAPNTRVIVAPFAQLVGSFPVFCAALLIGFVYAKLMSAGGTNAPSLFDAFANRDKDALIAALLALGPAGLTVGLAGAGTVALSWRNAFDVAAREPYRDGLRRLGLNEKEILNVYVVRHALALTLRGLPDILLALFAAAAVAEWIFLRPGAGAAFIHAVALKNWTVAAVIIFVIAAIRAGADFAGPLVARALASDEAAP